MHFSLVTLVITFVIGLTVIQIEVSAMWTPCKPCTARGADCEAEPPGICIWGETRDACGRRVCAKGPGDRCGGVLKVLGDCGEGMMCKSDERCHGCSIQTMECFNDD